MPQEPWEAVDRYLCSKLLPSDPALEAALRDSASAGLPEIQVSPLQGKLLQMLARTARAKRILEIGTLGGYSTICLARALSADGRLITLELEPKHADVARGNLARAGLLDRVEIMVGSALTLLPTLVTQAPFDFVFIDADKVNTARYFEWAMKLTRVGGLVVVDNVVRKGAVADASKNDPSLEGIRTFLDAVASNPRFSATAIQTVGGKGYDGFAVIELLGDSPRDA